MIPVWVQVVGYLVAAFGGAGTLLQLLRMYQSWRDGVRQRQDEADERLVSRLEKIIEYKDKVIEDRDLRIAVLERGRSSDGEYILVLVTALAQADQPIPMRPVKGPEEG
jgi:hypothetical protein